MFQNYDEMEAIRNTIERRLGITYEEFMSMDFSEQLKPLSLRRKKKREFNNIFLFNAGMSTKDEMKAIDEYNNSKKLIRLKK